MSSSSDPVNTGGSLSASGSSVVSNVGFSTNNPATNDLANPILGDREVIGYDEDELESQCSDGHVRDVFSEYVRYEPFENLPELNTLAGLGTAESAEDLEKLNVGEIGEVDEELGKMPGGEETALGNPSSEGSTIGGYRVPVACDKEGRLQKYIPSTVHPVHPYVENGVAKKPGSGIFEDKLIAEYYIKQYPSRDARPPDTDPHGARKWYFNISENSNLRPWEGEDDEETVPTDIENPDDSDDEHESSKDERYEVYGPGDIPDVRGALFDPRKSASHVNFIKIADASDYQDVEDAPGMYTLPPGALKDFLAKCGPFHAHARRRVLVVTQSGDSLCIDHPCDITIFPARGEPPKTIAYNPANLTEMCWSLIKSDSHTLSVACLDRSLQVRDDITLHNVLEAARLALVEAPATLPSLDFYTVIQSSCFGTNFEVSSHAINFCYHELPKYTSRLVVHFLLHKPLGPPVNIDAMEQLTNGTSLPTDEMNLNVSQFIKQIYIHSHMNVLKPNTPGKPLALLDSPFLHLGVRQPFVMAKPTAGFVDIWNVPEHVEVPKPYVETINGPFDLQGMNWMRRVGFTPSAVRRKRDACYLNTRHADVDYVNIGYPLGNSLAHGSLFESKSYHSAPKPVGSHFQLRNMLAARSHVSLVYANGPAHKVYLTHPQLGMQKTLIDLSKTNDDTVFAEPVKISTLALSNDETRSVVCIGGMDGEYAYRSLDTYEDQVVVGFATKKTGGIVNHIDIDYHSAASQLHAVISCNDGVVRVLDCETDTFLHAAQDTGTGFGGGFRFGLQKPKFSNGEASGFTYPWPINCSAASPDGKLRVLVGDTCDVIITNTQNGRLERLIKGHHDYCFACAWSPDGNLVVTGGQDRLVKTWDSRYWGVVSEWQAPVSAIRSLKFSPVGGGRKCLLAAEAADRVWVVDGGVGTQDRWETGNQHSFYGECWGVDFINDGSAFWVGNGDPKFGGVMEYQRRVWNARGHGLGFLMKDAIESAGDVYREEGYEEWIADMDRMGDNRCVDPTKDGRGSF